MRNCNLHWTRNGANSVVGSFKRLQLGFWWSISHETHTEHRTIAGKDDEKFYFGWFYPGYKDKMAVLV